MLDHLNITSNTTEIQHFLVLHTKESWSAFIEESSQPTVPSFFTGDKGDNIVWPHDEKIYYYVGLGTDTDFKHVSHHLTQWGIKYSSKLLTKKLGIINNTNADIGLACLLGVFRSDYSMKPQANEHFLAQLEVLDLPPSWLSSVDKAKALASAQKTCMHLLNLPANAKNPKVLSEWVRDFAATNQLEMEMFDREQAYANNLHAFLAVNRGSEYGGQFVVLHYRPKKAKVRIGLVGKCVTFDTGGISIKASANLHLMKSDMGGACAVIGALEVASRLSIPAEIYAVLPITDNAVSERSYIPSDVISSHSGKTIEIIDTDAEGRLTLADGLSYLIKNNDLDYIIDLATLTGSAVRTFGSHCAAIFCENETLLQRLQRSGKETGENVWPLPLWAEYKEHLHSDVADIKNYSGNPTSGACDAAAFLREFTHGHASWAHLDIAGVAFGNTPFGKDRGATGYGVHLLLNFLESICADNM